MQNNITEKKIKCRICNELVIMKYKEPGRNRIPQSGRSRCGNCGVIITIDQFGSARSIKYNVLDEQDLNEDLVPVLNVDSKTHQVTATITPESRNKILDKVNKVIDRVFGEVNDYDSTRFNDR